MTAILLTVHSLQNIAVPVDNVIEKAIYMELSDNQVFVSHLINKMEEF